MCARVVRLNGHFGAGSLRRRGRLPQPATGRPPSATSTAACSRSRAVTRQRGGMAGSDSVNDLRGHDGSRHSQRRGRSHDHGKPRAPDHLTRRRTPPQLRPPAPACPGRPARTVTTSSHSQSLHDSTTPVKFEDPLISAQLPPVSRPTGEHSGQCISMYLRNARYSAEAGAAASLRGIFRAVRSS